MTKTKAGILLLLVSVSVHGFELSISGIEAGFGFHPGYNRSFHFFWDISAFGSIELNKTLTLGAGIARGQIMDVYETDLYAFADYAIPFFRKYVPLNIKCAYLYNGLPDYETHIHTLLPLLSVNWRYLSFSFGETLRFTSFAGNPVLFEPVLAYSVRVYAYNTENTTVGIGLGSFDDFTANNIGAYFFSLNNRFRINRLVSISGLLRIDISGNVGHLTSVYGLSFREGIIFSW